SGHCMSDIDKEGTGKAYPAGLSEMRTFAAMAKAHGKTFGVGAIVLTHGECDSANMDYENELHQMWLDYATDAKAITAQTLDPVLILSQQSTLPDMVGISFSALAQWHAGVAWPGQIACAGPKYQYKYAADRIHLDSPGYVRLGEKYAEVYRHVVDLRDG